MVNFDEEKKIKDKRPQTAQELIGCDAIGNGEVIQRPPEKPRPSTVSKRLRPNHRDKESLLDELLELKNAIIEQAFHMKLHIQYVGQVQEENDQLEKNIESLELAYGLEAPRVGGECKLTSKLLGLKARLREKQLICNSRTIEIGLLQKDIRVTHCRELEVERDLFAAEIGTLQKTIRGLRCIFICVDSENDEIKNVYQKMSKLESINKDLKSSIEITKKSIEGSKSKIVEYNKQSFEAKSATYNANSKFLQLEAHSLVLKKLKHQEECETMKLEYSILKVGDDTRQILKDRLVAEKAALYIQQAAAKANAPVEVKKKIKVLDQGSGFPNEDAMTQLEVEFLAQVETAAVEFIETVPASQPPFSKTAHQIKAQHTIFETRKDFFTSRVEEAEIQLLMAMEEIEYGQAKSKLGQSSAKMFATAEKARLAAEVFGKQLAEDAKKAKEEVVRLQAELDRLKGMGSGDKRWISKKVNIMVGDKCLSSKEYKVQMVDKGIEIDIDIDIPQSTLSAMASCAGSPEALENARAKAKAEAKCLDGELKEAMRKAQGEAQRLSDEMRKVQVERDKLAAELATLQSTDFGGKRWKFETVSVVMGKKKLSKEEYKVEVLDKGAQIDIDVQIEGISSKIGDELEAVKKNLFDGESHALINTNIKEVLQHLENIADVVNPKSSQAGSSKKDVDSGGHS